LLQLKESKEVKITTTFHFKIPIKDIKTCVMGRLSSNDKNWQGGGGLKSIGSTYDTVFFSIFKIGEYLE
jgi:hypothetical protein